MIFLNDITHLPQNAFVFRRCIPKILA